MLMLFTLALTMAMSTAAEPGTVQEADQQKYARVLRSGPLEDRYKAARELLNIPAERREERLWLELADELQRVNTLSHQRDDALRAGRQVESLGSSHGEYHRDLIEAVSQWRDSRALPPLISSAGSGLIAIGAIVRFGDAAVVSLVEAARSGHSSETGGVLRALQILMEGMRNTSPSSPQSTLVFPQIAPTTLSGTSREQIRVLVRDLLRPGAVWWPHLQPLARLALAIDDQALRREVESLAREPGLVTIYGVDHPVDVERVQRQLQQLLAQYPSSGR